MSDPKKKGLDTSGLVSACVFKGAAADKTKGLDPDREKPIHGQPETYGKDNDLNAEADQSSYLKHIPDPLDLLPKPDRNL